VAEEIGRRLRATVTHTLSARFVDIHQPSVAEFDRDGVSVRVDARVRETHSFATIVCSGAADITGAASESLLLDAFPIILSKEGDPLAHQAEVQLAWSVIEPVLRQVGAVLRWRFGIFGDDRLWNSTNVVIEIDGRVIELAPIPQAAMGDDKAVVGPYGLRDVAHLVGASAAQPLAHEMWREAWNLYLASPRSGLVMGVAAAEVGVKQLITLLAPDTAKLLEHVQSPTLDILIRKVLPSLLTRSGTDAGKICPQHLRKRLLTAVEERNRVVHRGAIPTVELRSTLLDIRDFLYLLDWNAGHAWAEALLSHPTRSALELS
jgi:hypothetical protein